MSELLSKTYYVPVKLTQGMSFTPCCCAMLELKKQGAPVTGALLPQPDVGYNFKLGYCPVRFAYTFEFWQDSKLTTRLSLLDLLQIPV